MRERKGALLLFSLDRALHPKNLPIDEHKETNSNEKKRQQQQLTPGSRSGLRAA